jgi:uncharacterized protein (TIGR03437 family)
MKAMKTIVYLLASAALFAQAPAAPTNLKVSSATSKQVALTWTGSTGATSYVVQRRALGGVYASLSQALTPSASSTTFTDTTIDAFTTYSYRVFAVSGGGTSTGSNEVPMGPPPVGFSMVSITPTIALDPAQYGRQVSLALDANGDPAIAFMWINPSNSSNAIDSVVYFVGWDRANYQWKSPVKVDVCGYTNQNSSNIVLSMAADPSNGMLAMVYQKSLNTNNGDQLSLALSTDAGATWKLQAVPVNGTDSVNYPSLALAGGQAYLAFWNDTSGITYFTGSETAAPSSWTKTAVPNVSKSGSFRGPLGLALDSTGKAGIAYWFDETGGPSIGFWRAGSAASTRVLATNTQNDGPDLRLAFAGTQPRILFFGYLSYNAPPYSNEVWITQSSDGNSWSKPVALPNDGSSDWQGPLGFAIKSTGFATGVAIVNSGNNSIPGKCGFPKWSQSADLVSWTTCSPQGNGHPLLTSVFYPSAAYGANDKIYLAFLQFDNTNAELPTGVILYREPLVAGQVPPVLGTGGVVNGASFTPGGSVAPGSIISIFGTNIAGAAGGSTSVPLSTTLADASVTIAGRLSPLYYVSPAQINAQLPFETPAGTQQAYVTVNGLQSNIVTVPVAAAAPGIFLYNGNYAVAQRADYSVIDSVRPVQEGQVIILYATGQGSVTNQPATGAGAPGGPTAQANQTVTATIGGKNAPVQYAGLVAGFVGLLQVNLQTPTGLAAGDYPLILTIGGSASNSALLSVIP